MGTSSQDTQHRPTFSLQLSTPGPTTHHRVATTGCKARDASSSSGQGCEQRYHHHHHHDCCRELRRHSVPRSCCYPTSSEAPRVCTPIETPPKAQLEKSKPSLYSIRKKTQPQRRTQPPCGMSLAHPHRHGQQRSGCNAGAVPAVNKSL